MRVAFCGPIGAGKTTASAYLADRYGLPRFSLAEGVREVAALRHAQPERSVGQLFGWVSANLPDWPESKQEDLVWRWLDVFCTYLPEPGRKPRLLLNNVGQVGRKVDPDLWIDLLLRRIGNGPAVIDDLRFMNEWEKLSKSGFKIVRITAPENVRQKRVTTRDGIWDAKADALPGEREWPVIPVEAEVNNAGSLVEFQTSLEGVIAKVAFRRS